MRKRDKGPGGRPRRRTSLRGQGQSSQAALESAASPSEFDSRPPFPIVGIGASAGGLEALEQFLGQVPSGSGMAFVIVQHLDPTHEGMMPELLQRATSLPVVQVKDRTQVQPDSVYVIPPNKDMSLLHGVLHLLAPAAPRGLRLPIDFFLRSLALDQQERSIGVILSGMGSDGTLGLRDIKEKGGLVLVQEPATAKFDGMPRSAIDAGLADIVASARELPRKILGYLQHIPLTATPQLFGEDRTQSALDKAVILLRGHTGHDFSLYKKNTLYRRIERRMGIHQIGKMAHYVRYLQENSQELDLLFKELLIGVTSFFRDPAAWERLRDDAIPALFATQAPGQALRAWVPGCSTGEEAYSLAIVFKEALSKIRPKSNYVLQLFATDLDQDAISLRIPTKAYTHSDSCRTPARPIRTVIGAKRRYGSVVNEVYGLSQDFRVLQGCRFRSPSEGDALAISSAPFIRAGGRAAARAFEHQARLAAGRYRVTDSPRLPE